MKKSEFNRKFAICKEILKAAAGVGATMVIADLTDNPVSNFGKGSTRIGKILRIIGAGGLGLLVGSKTEYAVGDFMDEVKDIVFPMLSLEDDEEE